MIRCPHCGQEVALENKTVLVKPRVPPIISRESPPNPPKRKPKGNPPAEKPKKGKEK